MASPEKASITRTSNFWGSSFARDARPSPGMMVFWAGESRR